MFVYSSAFVGVSDRFKNVHHNEQNLIFFHFVHYSQQNETIQSL
jgi:hypothetical protein